MYPTSPVGAPATTHQLRWHWSRAACCGRRKRSKTAGPYPRPPSQQVSQIVWQREHWSLARISISSPPHAGQAGRGAVSLSSDFFSSMLVLPATIVALAVAIGQSAFFPRHHRYCCAKTLVLMWGRPVALLSERHFSDERSRCHDYLYPDR